MFRKRSGGAARNGTSGSVPVADGSWWQLPTLTPVGFRQVVGESHYQDAIAAAVNRWGVREVVAQLVPEPSNKHDRNAIRVCIDGGTVGYLAREETSEFHFAIAAMAGTPATARASITGGVAGKAHYGVVLNCSPEPFPQDSGFLFGGKTYSVSVPKSTLSDVLDLIPTGANTQTYLVVDGKVVLVQVGGTQVGKLSKPVSEDYRLVVEGTSAAGIPPATMLESTLNSSSGAPKFVIRLPQEPTRWFAVCKRAVAERIHVDAPPLVTVADNSEAEGSSEPSSTQVSSAQSSPSADSVPAVTHPPGIEDGWYPDPLGQADLRWWDGSAWTDQTHNQAVPVAKAASSEPTPLVTSVVGVNNLPAEGWYPDPHGRHEQRFWNGKAWTNSVLVDGQSIFEPGT